MKCFFCNHRKLVASVLLLVALGAWWLSAPVRGKLAAHFDVARGSYRVLTYGLPPSWLPECTRLLHERYGVKLNPVAVVLFRRH